MISHAAIVPLIGGMVISQTKTFGSQAHWMASYGPFASNDSQIRNYYKDVPYHVLTDDISLPKVDVVGALCPCAGLSSLSTTSSASSETNDWMYDSTEFVLKSVKPRVLWGENAPRLASNAGKPVVDKLRKIAEANGYSMALYRTKSLLHGAHQLRDRSFYFFFDTPDRVPVLPYVEKTYEQNVAEYIASMKFDRNDPMSLELASDKKPSEDPMYSYVLNVIHGGITHAEFAAQLKKTCYIQDYIEEHTTYDKLSVWMREHGHSRFADKCMRLHAKLESGGNIMRRGLIVPCGHVGAFVGSMPYTLVHPKENRFLTIRECLNMMYMPHDFQLIGGKSNLNVICQSVPLKTANSMCAMIKDYLEGKLDYLNTGFVVFDNKAQTLYSEPLSVELF